MRWNSKSISPFLLFHIRCKKSNDFVVLKLENILNKTTHPKKENTQRIEIYKSYHLLLKNPNSSKPSTSQKTFWDLKTWDEMDQTTKEDSKKWQTNCSYNGLRFLPQNRVNICLYTKGLNETKEIPIEMKRPKLDSKLLWMVQALS